jgi:hypothetical protein
VRKCFLLAAALIAACQFAAVAAATEPNDHMVRKTYQVADLVIPLPSATAGTKAKPVSTTCTFRKELCSGHELDQAEKQALEFPR